MIDDVVLILQISTHPFYTGLIIPEQCNELPVSLPFNMGIHPIYAIPRLVITDVIRRALNDAYSAGSMASTPSGESPLAAVRMNEVLEKMLFLFDGTVRGKKLLEIGCGNGELLNQLKLKGASVTGLEIGPQAQVAEDRYGIKVLREPLAVGALAEEFDCIYSYGCLEHIEDINGFFTASRSCLKNGGLFFHSVPNFALSFEHIHLDHLLHEHVNYFMPANGVALLEAQGFSSASASLTKAGNEVMIWGFHQAGAVPRWPTERISVEIALLEDYSQKLERKIKSTLGALTKIAAKGQTIGFYAGGFEYGFHLTASNIRYFDGDIYKHGKQWLPGSALIEAPVALIAEPVDCLVVCKPHYFPAIKNALVEIGVDQNCIVDIDSLELLPA
jgi:2-polyprenyl-3-methyl-5-hydroxy-6-metoxy-1,4-benzoquinol methylase